MSSSELMWIRFSLRKEAMKRRSDVQPLACSGLIKCLLFACREQLQSSPDCGHGAADCFGLQTCFGS